MNLVFMSNTLAPNRKENVDWILHKKESSETQKLVDLLPYNTFGSEVFFEYTRLNNDWIRDEKWNDVNITEELPKTEKYVIVYDIFDSDCEKIRLEEVVFFQEGPGVRKFQMSNEGVPLLNIRLFRKDGVLDFTNCNYVSKDIAFAVGKVAQEEGYALEIDDELLRQRIESHYWKPEYRFYKRVSI